MLKKEIIVDGIKADKLTLQRLQAKADAIYERMLAGATQPGDSANLRALEWRIEAIYERLEAKKIKNYDTNYLIIK